MSLAVHTLGDGWCWSGALRPLNWVLIFIKWDDNQPHTTYISIVLSWSLHSLGTQIERCSLFSELTTLRRQKDKAQDLSKSVMSVCFTNGYQGIGMLREITSKTNKELISTKSWKGISDTVSGEEVRAARHWQICAQAQKSYPGVSLPSRLPSC